MSNNQCSLICNDPIYLSTLARLRLTNGNHNNGDHPDETLIDSLSGTPIIDDARSIITALTSNQQHPSLDASCIDLYERCVIYEYGLQSRILRSRPVSTVGLLCTISKAFSVDIYVVCGLLPIKMTRESSNVVKISFSESEETQNLVVGLVGISKFHQVVQEDSEALCWRLLDENSVVFGLHELFERYRVINRRLNVDPDSSEDIMEAEEEESEDSGVNFPQHDGNHLMESISIQSFLTDHYELNDENNFVVDESSYTDDRTISYFKSEREDVECNNIDSYHQMMDIDGFFGYFNWKNRHAFKGNAKVIPNPKWNCRREQKTFIKVCKDSGKEFEEELLFFKVANIITNFGQFDYFFAVELRNNVNVDQNLSRLEKITKDAFNSAIKADCIDSLTGIHSHIGCQNHQYRSIVDAQSSKVNNIFEGKRFSCFCYHFQEILRFSLAREGFLIQRPLAYVQMVSTKSTLFANNANSMASCLSEINKYFDLDRMKCFVDFSISTMARLRNPLEKVIFSVKVCFCFYFLGFNFLEEECFNDLIWIIG